MVGVLIVSYGALADALISEAQFLVGRLQKVKGVSIWPEESEEEVKGRIREKMAEVDDGDGVVILADILGGAPANLSLSFLKDKTVEAVTGVNIPMLLALSSYRKGRSLEESCSLVKKAGRQSIILVKETFGVRRKARMARGWSH